MANPPRKQIKWNNNITFNPGVDLPGQIVTMEAVAVGDKIVWIFPKQWGVDLTKEMKEATIKAFAGRLVFIEVKVGYQTTGRFCEYDDYGR